MNIEKIKELISIIKDSSTSESNKKRAVADLKRMFGFHMQDVKTRGKKINPEIKKEIESLLSDYEPLKDFEGINEILSSIASEYIEIADNDPNSPFKDKAIDIHIKILGNPGTNSTGFSKEYIEKIIIGKLTTESSFNKLDIINVLREQGETLSEDFQDLIEQIVIPDVELDINNPDIESRNLKNPEILDVLSNLAASYKYDAEFEKAQEILEKALKLTQFKDDYLYKNIKKDFDELNTLNNNFDVIDISTTTLEEFKDTIKNHLGIESINSPTFVQPTSHTPRPHNPNPGPKPTVPTYKMPFDKKCEAIYRLIENLKKNFPDIAFDELKVGKNKFDSYHIITLKNANFTILENFNDSNEGIYLIDNDILYAALQETKTDAKQKYPDKISSANHVQDFEQYVINLTGKASDKLDYSPVKKSSKRSKVSKTPKTKDYSKVEKTSTDTEITPEKSDITSKTDLNSIDLTSLSIEELNKISASYDEEIDKTDAETEQLQNSIQTLEDRQKAEAERQILLQHVLAKRTILASKKIKRDELKQKEENLKKSLNDSQKDTRKPGDNNF